MGRIGFTFSAIGLLLSSVGCGGSDSRLLESIKIDPPTANAQDFPNGQVQFVSTGRYNRDPLTMSPLPAMWVIYPPHGETGATITQSGIAQCVAGASGTFMVLAYAPADPKVPLKLPLTGRVAAGTALLTCP